MADLFSPDVPFGLLGPNAPSIRHSSDLFSDDGSHRFYLEYWWDDALEPLICIGQNPSKANRRQADATVTRVARRAWRAGLGGHVMLNLHSYVATFPSDLWAADIARADDMRNVDIIADVLDAFPSAPVLFAPGGDAHPRHRARAAEVERMIRRDGRPILCLGTTQAGLPRHPSRLGYDVEMVPWLGSFARA